MNQTTEKDADVKELKTSLSVMDWIALSVMFLLTYSVLKTPPHGALLTNYEYSMAAFFILICFSLIVRKSKVTKMMLLTSVLSFMSFIYFSASLTLYAVYELLSALRIL